MTADTDNPLVMEVLTASSTAYSYYPDVKISEVCKALIFYPVPVERGLGVKEPGHYLA